MRTITPILFVVNNWLAVIIAAIIADIALKNREPWRKALAVIGTFPVLVVFGALLLGGFGKLSAIAVTLLLSVFCIILKGFQPPIQANTEPQNVLKNKVLWTVGLLAL